MRRIAELNGTIPVEGRCRSSWTPLPSEVSRLLVEGEEKRATTAIPAEVEATTRNHGTRARGGGWPCHSALAYARSSVIGRRGIITVGQT